MTIGATGVGVAVAIDLDYRVDSIMLAVANQCMEALEQFANRRVALSLTEVAAFPNPVLGE